MDATLLSRARRVIDNSLTDRNLRLSGYAWR